MAMMSPLFQDASIATSGPAWVAPAQDGTGGCPLGSLSPQPISTDPSSPPPLRALCHLLQVLIAVDESPHLRAMLDFALRFQAIRRATDQLHLVTMLPPPSVVPFPSAPLATSAAITEDWMRGTRSRMHAKLRGNSQGPRQAAPWKADAPPVSGIGLSACQLFQLHVQGIPAATLDFAPDQVFLSGPSQQPVAEASTLPRATGGASGLLSPEVCLRTAWRSDEPRMGRGFARALFVATLLTCRFSPAFCCEPCTSIASDSNPIAPLPAVRSFFSTSGDAAVGEVALSNAADDPKAALRPMVPTLPAAGAQPGSTHTCCSKQLQANHKEEQAAKIIRLRHQLQTSGKANTAGAQLVQGGELQQACDVVSDAYLYRWLRARSWDVALAATDIVKHAQWRVAFMPNGGISQEAVAKELATEKLILQGFDCHGRPLVIILVRKHNAWTRSVEELKRLCCYVLDLIVRMAVVHAERNPRGQCTVLLDLTDMAMVSMDVQAIRTLFNLLGDHYVERLGCMVFWNPPKIFWGAWNALKPMLPPATLARIFVIDPLKAAALVELVGNEALPREYGGSAALAAPLSI
ncbi:hypothetical protein V8C86DRAFT_3029481 [Haematococcus lacustris]